MSLAATQVNSVSDAGQSLDRVGQSELTAEELAAMVRGALEDARIDQKAAAITMGIDPALLSRQLASEKHLSLQRLAGLPPLFWWKFSERLTRRFPQTSATAQAVADTLQACSQLIRHLVVLDALQRLPTRTGKMKKVSL